MDRTVNKRWYDSDPTVSLAISFLRNAPSEQQKKAAQRIIQSAKELDIKISEVRLILQRRWYDEDETLSNAIEYFKKAPIQIQRLIALDIINFLTEIK
jgi:hypothetical protein